MKRFCVNVPATTANLGPGFDCLGMALSLHNRFIFSEIPHGLEITTHGEGIEQIPTDGRNLVVQAVNHICTHLGRQLTGLRLEQTNHVPAASGMGSSSTAVIAGLLGGNALLGSPLTKAEILQLATDIEGHPDNVAPAIFGGLVLVPLDTDGHCEYIEHIPIPELNAVLVLPEFDLLTADARAALPPQLSRADAIFNVSHMGLVIRALEQGDYTKLAIGMQDRIHQPYRMALVPGMAQAMQAAKEAGAAAVAISGSGPSLIAFAPSGLDAIGQAMKGAYQAHGLNSRMWLIHTDSVGSTVTQLQDEDQTAEQAHSQPIPTP